MFMLTSNSIISNWDLWDLGSSAHSHFQSLNFNHCLSSLVTVEETPTCCFTEGLCSLHFLYCSSSPCSLLIDLIALYNEENDFSGGTRGNFWQRISPWEDYCNISCSLMCRNRHLSQSLDNPFWAPSEPNTVCATHNFFNKYSFNETL